MFIKHHLKTIAFVLSIGFMTSAIIFSILHEWELAKNQDATVLQSGEKPCHFPAHLARHLYLAAHPIPA